VRAGSGSIAVHTDLRVEGDVTRFEVRSPGPDDEAIHCRGEAARSDAPEARRLDIPAMLERGRRVAVGAEQLYREYRDMGIEYGPSFQGYEAAYSTPEGIVARLRIPAVAAETIGGFAVHPVIVDSAMQCMRLLPAPGGGGGGRLLFAIKSVDVVAPCTAAMWAWIRVAGGDRGAEKIDMDIVDDRGAVCVTLRGIATRRVGAEAEPKGSPAVALLPVWEATPEIRGGRWPDAAQPVVVVGGTEEARDALSRRYAAARVIAVARGSGVEEIDRTLRAAGPFEHLFWLSPEAAPGAPTADAIVAGQSRGALEAFRVVKALLGAGHADRPLGLTWLTHRAHAAHHAERSDPTHAGIAGLVGSLAKEHPRWKVRAADVRDYDAATLDAVLGLPADPDGDTRLFRNGQWLSQRLMTMTPSAPARRGLRRDGVYVIAGGAGGLGVAISEYLIREYGAQAIWLGRRAKDARIEAAIAGLSSPASAPHYVQADATSRASLRDARDAIERRFGEVHGVIQSALVFSGASIAKTTEAQLRAVLAAKVDVSVNLMEAFRGPSLELALFLSSINSYLKAMGQASYAAACTFLDAFAVSAARGYGCEAKVVNLGYCFNNVEDGDSRGAAVSKAIEFIRREELMAGIETLVAGEMSQMTLMKFSPAVSTRGIVLGGDRVLLPRAEAAALGPATRSEDEAIADALARVPQIRDRMKELTALAL